MTGKVHTGCYGTPRGVQEKLPGVGDFQAVIRTMRKNEPDKAGRRRGGGGAGVDRWRTFSDKKEQDPKRTRSRTLKNFSRTI